MGNLDSLNDYYDDLDDWCDMDADPAYLPVCGSLMIAAFCLLAILLAGLGVAIYAIWRMTW